MADQSGGGNRSESMLQGASPQMLKTVGLIVAALLIGVVLLNVVDDGKTAAVKPSNNSTSSTKPATTGTDPGKTTKPTQPASKVVRKPLEFKIMVLNASGVSGVAKTMASALRTKGYTSQQDAATAVTVRTGTAVQCRAGFDGEAAALLVQVANKAKSEPFPATVPKISGKSVIDPSVQCLVIIGK